MAVRDESTSGNPLFRIWLGTLVHPTPRPLNYASGGALNPGEEATGAIHMLTWQPGSSTVPVVTSMPLSPTTTADRGGYGVVGMTVANLLPDTASGTNPAYPGDELIVTTVAGDVFVYNINPTSHQLSEVIHTHLPGAAGYCNSIHVIDLDDDGKPELYIGGSLGLWRFVLQGE